MPQKTNQIIIYFSIIIIAIASIFWVNGLILAWSSPSVSPPQGNVNAPLNISTDTQYKEGALGVGGLLYGYSDAGFDGSVSAPSFLYSSDRELKKNIQAIPSSLDKVLKLNGILFQWKDSDELGMGLIAQDVEKVFPELVKINETTGLKSVQYGNLVAPLIEAIKEQQKQIDQLKEEIEELRK